MEMKRLLIVEESFDYGSFLVSMLQTHCGKRNVECMISLAKHPSEAIFLLEEHLPDPTKRFHAVMSAFGLSGLNGIEFLLHVRKLDPDIAFILMSEWKDKNLEKLALEKGATAFFVKSDHTIMDAVCDALISKDSL